MELNLCKYANKKICVAVSGGRDSMALLHYLVVHAKEYGITLSALNCDHKIRGEASARDSAFVKEWCRQLKIPLLFFEWNTDEAKTEASARIWRVGCYCRAIENGADAVATAHHMNDNAETVLFNLARGSSLSGMRGITDSNRIIRPLIACSRAEIDAYIEENAIPYVEDETNFTDDYTRNKIRRNVLPELEKAVPGATENIYRFSRLVAEDERYFERIISEKGLINFTPDGFYVKLCEEKVVFGRAVIKALRDIGKRDYTSEHARRLFELQFAENGKKFGFLGLTAVKEEDRIYFLNAANDAEECGQIAFSEYKASSFCGVPLVFFTQDAPITSEGKILKFDLDAIPGNAVIRFMKAGDKFKKFGGGAKNLGDYFTDLKIPARVRPRIPLIACGSEILLACGVEISETIKITQKTKAVGYVICADYRK